MSWTRSFGRYFDDVRKAVRRRKKELADLNAEASNAAGFYIEKRGSGMPTDEKQRALNYVAHGFFMGYRKCEEQNGID